jgi:pyridoxal phosphate enzyme (YggS family)
MNTSYKAIVEECNKHQAQLIAVSKTKPVIDIKQLYVHGQIAFGENKVQELCEKYDALPKDIQWHLIGHLQTNKVKYIVSFVHCIHSVDSLKLIDEIQKEAAKIYRRVNILLQFHIAEEETKFGLNLNEAIELLEFVQANNEKYNYVNIVGVMGMASFTEDENKIASEFKALNQIFLNLKNTFFPFQNSFKEISMGMSSDYKIALKEGSTMVRIGSLLFGSR